MNNIKFQLSNGYPLQFDQIAQILEYILTEKKASFSTKELAENLGLAGRQIKNLCSMAVAMQLMNARVYTPTTLGSTIHQNDRFFDDIGTLWLCHYNLASNPTYVVWNRLVHCALPKHDLTREDMRECFEDLRGNYSEYTLKAHLRKEIYTFVGAYTEGRFSKLRLLVARDERYSLLSPVPIPDMVFLAMIAQFKERFHHSETALEIQRIVSEENSPGRVCFMTDEQVRECLERLRVSGRIYIESKADLDQLRFAVHSTPEALMEQYYDERFRG